MSKTIAVEVDDQNPSVVDDMLASIRGSWSQAESYQKFAYVIGALLITSGLFHLGVLIVTGGAWEGPVSWRKAMSFGLSFGITTVSLAWIMNFLPKRRVLNWVLMGVLGLAIFGEVFLVTMQKWRGVASHFNFATSFDSTVFTLMGILIAIVGIVTVVITMMSFFTLKASPSIALAIRVGLLLFLVSTAAGGFMIQNGNEKVFASETRAFVSSAVADASIFGAAGQVKFVHAVTLHALQLLPFLAWLMMFTSLSERQRKKNIWLATVGYVGLAAVISMQTLNGVAPFDLNLLAAIVLGLSIILILFAFGRTLLSLQPT